LDDFDKAYVNSINGIISSILALLVLVLSGFGYYLYQIDMDHKRKEEKTTRNWACGTTGRFNKSRSIHDSSRVDFKNIELGKTLFRNNCATCHNKNMRDDLEHVWSGFVMKIKELWFWLSPFWRIWRVK
jgi:hypothetical protein